MFFGRTDLKEEGQIYSVGDGEVEGWKRVKYREGIYKQNKKDKSCNIVLQLGGLVDV